MINTSNFMRFQESITKELDVIKNRVRNLIKDANWAEEGRYKEAILRNVIKRFLPNNLSLGTGFIISKNNDKLKCSTQIDIIIYNNTIPVLFSEGDFIITTYKNVKGIIEVKTRLNDRDLRQIINKAKQNLSLFINNNVNGSTNNNNVNRDNKDNNICENKVFNGIFAYEYNGILDSKEKNNYYRYAKEKNEEYTNRMKLIDDALKDANGYVNHLSLGKNIFIKFWDKKTISNSNVVSFENKCEKNFYNIYQLVNLSFSYFISNLLCMSCSDELDDRLWFLFPISRTKEKYKIKSICLE
ncbi:MAG: DUF6602 domain-containing protein [Candidatus Helarchaeota archaeon]